MALPFQPKPRTVVYCDFKGFVAPEIVKRRLVRSMKRDCHGRRQYLMPSIGAEQFDAVRKCVAHGLGLTSFHCGTSMPTVPARGIRDSGRSELDLDSDDKLPGP